ncbi:Clp protease ClpP [Clostridium botulinum]|nr:Clp protease ClpP [Clostridium botulinum]NFF37831.1 Clp protease ClpP [Clostridium botulinum]NFI50295.1 Clp protease ClpP [Clostridium botulinum]NFI61436.1 Clp protease ClpP [Clostridium botulinum]NFI71546.1 Clp protease ClpP [Clostridium botulinum]
MLERRRKKMKKIDIKGRIIPQSNKWIYNFLGIPATSAKDISSSLEDANGDDVEIYVNSGGGSVYDGYEIYNLIREYKGKVTFKVIGLAASAASFICMAGKCLMSPLAEMMIHNASTYAEGPHQNMDSTSNMLQITDSTIAKAYTLKSGKSEKEIRDLMENETWLSSEQCKELGLIDGIMFEENKVNLNPTPMIYNAISDDALLDELEKCTNVDELKKKLIENIFKESTMNQPIVVNSDSTIDDNKNNIKQEANKMDINTIKNEHKDVYDQIVNEAIKNERERIKSIEDLAIPGNEDIINKAKFETGDSAEKVALAIIQSQKNKGNDYLQSLKDDADNSNVNNIPAVKEPENKTSQSKDKEAAEFMAKYMNGGRD